MTPFIVTYTGKKVNPLDLRPKDVDIKDIAHHLAILNRFVGATKRPISVAQHSVFVSRLVAESGYGIEGLFHDAPEYVLGDVSKWLKQTNEMATYRAAEERAWTAICAALGLSLQLPDIVHQADSLMVRYEALRSLSHPEYLFEIESHPRPTPEEINSIGPWGHWSWRQSEEGFLDQARFLGYKL